jgi:hypothetical protein
MIYLDANKAVKKRLTLTQRLAKSSNSVDSQFFSVVLVSGLGAGGKSCALALAKAAARG